jgi:transketolase
MNRIADKQVICNVLMQEAEKDRDIVVACSDSRGSGSMTAFADAFPKQFVEVGIAEQSLVSVSAGLALCGKKVFAVSPASFLSTRSMEQAKVDVAYNHSNVTLIGISGGVSYGALGFTHHSTNDIASMASISGLRVYLPSDRFQTEKLIRALLKDREPAYVRVGRNAVEDVYSEGDVPFEFNRTTQICGGTDVTLIACGELVSAAKKAAELLKEKGVSARVLDMYCLKPIDREAVAKAARETKGIVTAEEHVAVGGLGSMVSQVVTAEHPARVRSLTLPDEPVVTGKSREVFDYYGLNAEGIAKAALELI